MTAGYDVEAQLTDVIHRLAAVENQLAITRLMVSYGPAVDAGHADEVANLWTHDGVYQVDSGALEGRDAIRGMVRSDQHQSWIRRGCAHTMTPPLVTVHGDVASAFCYTQLTAHDPVTGTFVVERTTANRWEFARTEAGWRVIHRSACLLDGSDEARAVLSAVVEPPSPERRSTR